MLGTYSASTVGVSRWTSPSRGASGRASGICSSFSVASASAPIATTIRGCTIAISSTTRAMHSGSASAESASGHFTHSVPYTASGSIARRLSDFISALPARP